MRCHNIIVPAVVMALAACCVLAQDERIHIIPVDLRTPLEDFRITFENETTPRVQIPVKRGGFDVPNTELSGWTGMFYYAESDTTVTGMTVTASLAGSVFDAVFDVTQIGPPGTYFAQLLFQRDDRVQEWRRGRLTIRGAGGADAVQTVQWNTTNMWARMDAIDARLDGHDSDIAGLTDAVGSGSALVMSNLTAHIDAADAKDAEQDAAIAANASGIVSNAAAIAGVETNLTAHIATAAAKNDEQDAEIAAAAQAANMGGDIEGKSTNATVIAVRNIPVAELFPGADEDGYGLKYNHATGELLLGPVASEGTSISNIVVLSGTATGTDVPGGSIGLYRTIRPGNLPSAVVNVGGYEVAWLDLLGMTLRAGSLHLLGDWLNVNTRAYDGTVTAPAKTYAAQPDMGQYRFSTGSGYAEGYATGGERIWYWDAGGITLEPGKLINANLAEIDPLSIHASSTYVAWTNSGGTSSTNAVIATSPLLTNGLQSVSWSAVGFFAVVSQMSSNQTDWIAFAPTANPVYVRISVTNDLPAPGDPTTSVSNIVATSWTRPDLFSQVNDTAGQLIMVDHPVHDRQVANKAYADTAAASITPANWSAYPATGTIYANGNNILLGGGWSMIETEGVGIISYADVWSGTNGLVIANNGTPAITAISGLAGLHIAHFSVDGGTGTVGITTNGITSEPFVQWTATLGMPDWIPLSPVSSSYPESTTNGWYEIIVNLPEGPQGFLRAVRETGAARVDVHSSLYIQGEPVAAGLFWQGTNLLSVIDGVTNRISMEVWP